MQIIGILVEYPKLYHTNGMQKKEETWENVYSFLGIGPNGSQGT